MEIKFQLLAGWIQLWTKQMVLARSTHANTNGPQRRDGLVQRTPENILRTWMHQLQSPP